jgi:hypothetical protein
VAVRCCNIFFSTVDTAVGKLKCGEREHEVQNVWMIECYTTQEVLPHRSTRPPSR